MISCALPVWGLGCYLSSQPTQHFFAFATSLDFEVSAVLLAFSFKSAEEINEHFEFVKGHFIGYEIFSDINEEVRMNICRKECPDFIKGGAIFAIATRHKGETRRFDRNVLVADIGVAVAVKPSRIVRGARYAVIIQISPFAGVACGARAVDDFLLCIQIISCPLSP